MNSLERAKQTISELRITVGPGASWEQLQCPKCLADTILYPDITLQSQLEAHCYCCDQVLKINKCTRCSGAAVEPALWCDYCCEAVGLR